MKRLYVAGQNPHTREWIPVAELMEQRDGYMLRYTRGAVRLPGFSGLGRMQGLDKTYHSPALFPFFSNRLIPKSRPEYRDYLRWVGLDTVPASPMELLAVTGGIRATDGYELIAVPRMENSTLRLDFFARGLRHLAPEVVELLMRQEPGKLVFLMKDVQNEKDSLALAIRTTDPFPVFAGYVPRYYALGITRLLDAEPTSLIATIRRINPDAPFDMKVLLTVEAKCPVGFDLLDDVSDFRPLTTRGASELSETALSRTQLDLPQG